MTGISDMRTTSALIRELGKEKLERRKITVVIGNLPDQPGVWHDVYLEVASLENFSLGSLGDLAVRHLIETGYLQLEEGSPLPGYDIAGAYEGHIHFAEGVV